MISSGNVFISLVFIRANNQARNSNQKAYPLPSSTY
jgi:hypothetical protein